MAQPVAPKTIRHKRGNTFVRGFRLWEDKEKTKRLDLTNYTIRSHVRKGAALIEVLVVTVTNALLGEFKLSSAPRTDSWPTVPLAWDVELTNTVTGQILSTETCVIACEKGITGPIV